MPQADSDARECPVIVQVKVQVLKKVIPDLDLGMVMVERLHVDMRAPAARRDIE